MFWSCRIYDSSPWKKNFGRWWNIVKTNKDLLFQDCSRFFQADSHAKRLRCVEDNQFRPFLFRFFSWKLNHTKMCVEEKEKQNNDSHSIQLSKCVRNSQVENISHQDFAEFDPNKQFIPRYWNLSNSQLKIPICRNCKNSHFPQSSSDWWPRP